MKLLFPQRYEVWMHLIAHRNLLNRLFSLDSFQGYLGLKFIVVPCTQSESYVSLCFFRKKGFGSTLFRLIRGSVFGVQHTLNLTLEMSQRSVL